MKIPPFPSGVNIRTNEEHITEVKIGIFAISITRRFFLDTELLKLI